MRRILLLAAAFLPSCGDDHAPAPALELDGGTRIIASFFSQDEVSVTYAVRVLAYHSIRAEVYGSLGVSILVSESRAEEAIALLNEVPDIRPFVSSSTVSDLPVRDWENEVTVDASIQEALETHDATSLLGRFLRKAVRESPAGAFVRHPVVVRVKWRTREFVHTDLTPATALEAVVLLARERGEVRLREIHVSLLPQD
jgi:hypothetical protein